MEAITIHGATNLFFDLISIFFITSSFLLTLDISPSPHRLISGWIEAQGTGEGL
jgi:hypothetical protein